MDSYFLPLDEHVYKMLIFEDILLLTFFNPVHVIHILVKAILFSDTEEKRLDLKFIIPVTLTEDDCRNTKNKNKPNITKLEAIPASLSHP